MLGTSSRLGPLALALQVFSISLSDVEIRYIRLIGTKQSLLGVVGMSRFNYITYP